MDAGIGGGSRVHPLEEGKRPREDKTKPRKRWRREAAKGLIVREEIPKGKEEGQNQ
jgi:hypothetical protein